MTPDELKKALAPLEKQLRRIAEALEAFVPEQQSTPDEPVCPHPEDQRLQMGPGWTCQACGYQEMPNP
jgi:hypothetical protein